LISAIGIDNVEEIIRVSIEVISSGDSNLGSSIEYSDLPHKVYSGEGKEISDAISDLETNFSKEIILSHCGIIAVGSEITAEQLAKIIDFCISERDITYAAKLVYTKNAEALLNCNGRAVSQVGHDLMGILRRKDIDIGIGNENSIYAIKSKLLSKDKKFYLPHFEVDGENFCFFENAAFYDCEKIDDKVSD
jgi:hypothetical protein